MKIPLFFTPPVRSSRHGFTLMEMLLVLSIIALLMGLVIFNLTDVTITARRQKAKADILTLREALMTYQMVNGALPTNEQGLSALWAKPTVEPVPVRWSRQMEEETKDPWGHSYQYRNPGKHNPDKYDLSSLGEDGQPDTEDDIGNWPDKPTAATP